MRRPSAVFTIALALGAIILAPLAGARADGREEGPREIERCQTIDKPGSYKLVNDLTFSATTGTCLTITADSVTIARRVHDHRAWFHLSRQHHRGDRGAAVLGQPAGHRRAERVDLKFRFRGRALLG